MADFQHVTFSLGPGVSVISQCDCHAIVGCLYLLLEIKCQENGFSNNGFSKRLIRDSLGSHHIQRAHKLAY